MQDCDFVPRKEKVRLKNEFEKLFIRNRSEFLLILVEQRNSIDF